MVFHSVQSGANLHVPLGVYDTVGSAANALTLPNQAQAYLANMATGNAAIEIDCTNDQIDFGNTTDNTAVRILGTGGLEFTTGGGAVAFAASPATTFTSGGTQIMSFASTAASFGFTEARLNSATSGNASLLCDGTLSITADAGNTSAGFLRMSFPKAADGFYIRDRDLVDYLNFNGATAAITVGGATLNQTTTFAGTGTVTFNGTADFTAPIHLNGAAGTSGQVLTSQGAGVDPVWAGVATTLDGLTDTTLTAVAQGDVLYHNGTAWVNLAPGTSGFVLTTNGAAANPSWTAAGVGDMTAAVYDPASITEQLVGLTATQTLTNKTLTSPVINTTITSTAGAIDWDIIDNTANALRVMEGLNAYLDIDTVNTLEAMSFGNATTNPSFSFLGTGAASFAGAVTVTGTTTANGVLNLTNLLQLNGSAGTANQALLSAGAGADPVWGDVMRPSVYDAAAIAEQLVGLTATQTLTNKTLTTPTLTTPVINTTITSTAGAIDWDIIDNTANALRIMEGLNAYLDIDTVNVSEAMSFGNATTNPTFNFLGTGLSTFAGAVTVSSGNVTLTSGDVVVTSGDLTLTSGNINATVATDINVADNTASAITIDDGTDNYLDITTTTGSEMVSLGNAANTPDFEFLGDGDIHYDGHRIRFTDNANGISIGNDNVSPTISVQSVALGGGTCAANAANSVAIGYNATSGANGTVLGWSASAAGGQGVAIGYQAQGSANSGVGIGYQCVSTSVLGVALAPYGGAVHTSSICLGPYTASTAANQFMLGHGSNEITECIIGGQGDTDATPGTNVTWRTTDGVGTNIAATDLIVRPGLGTGTGAGGNVTIQTAETTTTGSTLQTARARMIIEPDGDMRWNGMAAGSGNAWIYRKSGAVQTTDATATTLCSIALPSAANYNVAMAEVWVLGSRETTNDDWAVHRGCFCLHDGSWAIGGGTQTVHDFQTGSAGSIAFAITGGDTLEIQVTGAASQTWNWSGKMELVGNEV